VEIITAETSSQADRYRVAFVIEDVRVTVGAVGRSFDERHGFGAIIGRDILQRCELVYHGPAGTYTLRIAR
jgi:hypothetical protein